MEISEREREIGPLRWKREKDDRPCKRIVSIKEGESFPISVGETSRVQRERGRGCLFFSLRNRKKKF